MQAPQGHLGDTPIPQHEPLEQFPRGAFRAKIGVRGPANLHAMIKQRFHTTSRIIVDAAGPYRMRQK